MLRLLPVVGLLGWQVVAAYPAHASAGDLDASFGTGGKVITDIAGDLDEAFAVTMQDTDKIVAAGSAAEGNGSALGDFALVRYQEGGGLDPSFGTGGKVKMDFTGAGGDDVIRALAVLPNDRLVAAGHSRDRWALAQFKVNGALDPRFGAGGKVSSAIPGEIRGLAVQADGKLVAAGTTGSQFAVARYNANGSLDSTFGAGGMVTTQFPGVFFAEAHAVAVQADGKIVAAGNAGSDAFAVARYNPDGSLDQGFGSGGTVTTSFGGFFNEAFGMVLQPDGKIVAAGEVFNDDLTSAFAVARYLSDGSLDPGFGTAGKVTTDFAGTGVAAAVVMQANGRLVAAGTANPANGTGNDFALAGYRPDGSLDPTFGIGGKVTTDFGSNGLDRANALTVQADDKLVAAGSPNNYFGFGSDFGLARYLGN